MVSNDLLSTQGDRELFLETLINRSKDGILVINREGLVLFANPTAEEMFSDQEEDLLGYQIGMPAIQDDVELRLPHGDEIRTVEMRASPITWKDQQGYLVTLRDVTNRVRVEQELRQREELLRETGQMARVGGWEIDFEANTVWWSDVTRQIHEVPEGYEPTLGEAVEFFPPEVRPTLTETIQRAREDGVPYDLELPFVTAEGNELWVRAVGKRKRLPGGKMRVHGTFQDITEKKKARDRLQKSEQKYRSLFEHSINGFALHEIISDENGTPVDYVYLDVNQAFEKQTGLKPEDVIGKTASEVLIGVQETALLDIFARVAQTGEPEQFDFYSPQLERHFLISAYSPQEGQFATIFYDISDRVQAEEDLRFQANLLDAVGQAVIATNAEGQINYWNRAAEELYGWTAEEVRGKNILDVTPTGASQTQAEEIMSTLTAGEMWSGEFEVQHQDGTSFPVIITDTPILDEDGKLKGIIGVTTDISERVEAERARQRSERRFRALIENAQDMIAVMDEEGTIVYNSPAIQNVLGYTPEEHHGKKAFEFVHPDDLTKVMKYFQNQVREPKAEGRIEFRMQHKNGDYRVIESVGRNALKDPSIEGFVINSRDITQRHEHKKMIERQMELLFIQQQIASAGVETNDQDRIIEQTTELIIDAFSPNNGGVILLNERKGVLEHHPSYHFDKDVRSLTAGFGEGVVGTVAESGEPLNISNVNEFEGYRQLDPEVKSELCAPIQSGHHVWGVINVEMDQADAFSPADEHMLITAANQLATVLDKVHSVNESQRRMERLHALREIDRTISGSLDIEVTLNIVVDRMIKSLGVDAGAVLLYQPHLNALKFVSGRGFRTDQISQAMLSLGEDIRGKIVLERELTQIRDLPGNAVKSDFSRLAAQEDFVSYVGVPLIAKGAVVGVMEVFQRSALDPSQEWLEFLDTLAGQAAIAIDRLQLFHDLERSNFDLIRAYNEVIEGWAKALELRDKETEGHSRRVEKLTLDIARRMGVPGDKLAHIRQGALLHDIGKMGIPDEILHKPGKLSKAEWEVMHKHPTFAYELLSPIEHLKPALKIPYCHHEKWDGSGYPRGLQGAEIPLEARIFAVVDVWDALRSDRSYRDAWSDERALEHIKEQSGKHFDPQVVRVFLKIIEG